MLKLLQDQHYKLRFIIRDIVKNLEVKFSKSSNSPKVSSTKHSHYIIITFDALSLHAS